MSVYIDDWADCVEHIVAYVNISARESRQFGFLKSFWTFFADYKTYFLFQNFLVNLNNWWENLRYSFFLYLILNFYYLLCLKSCDVYKDLEKFFWL